MHIYVCAEGIAFIILLTKHIHRLSNTYTDAMRLSKPLILKHTMNQ